MGREGVHVRTASVGFVPMALLVAKDLFIPAGTEHPNRL